MPDLERLRRSQSPGNLQGTASTALCPTRAPALLWRDESIKSTSSQSLIALQHLALLYGALGSAVLSAGAELVGHYSASKPFSQPTPVHSKLLGSFSLYFALYFTHFPSVLFQNGTAQERALKEPQLWSLQLFYNILGTPVIEDK